MIEWVFGITVLLLFLITEYEGDILENWLERMAKELAKIPDKIRNHCGQ